jgi:ABC-type cobalamin/Fe3+-siderophores transport system ATPase subunit
MHNKYVSLLLIYTKALVCIFYIELLSPRISFKLKISNMESKILNKKIELIQWLSTLEDKVVIEKLIKFRKEESTDWWDSISDEEKKAIESGLNDADKNNLILHVTVRKTYEKWL